MLTIVVNFKDGTVKKLLSTKLAAVANFVNLKYRNRNVIENVVVEGCVYSMEDVNSIAVSYRKQMA